MSFSSIVSTLVGAPGTRGAAFLDPHGQAIATAGDRKALETLSAFQSVWRGELGRAAERAGLGAVSDVAMEFADARVLTSEVKDGYFILVVVDRDGMLAPARARLHAARESLKLEIG